MATKGIDVSTYQRNVDYKKLKASGIDFVIIRAGYGNALAYPSQFDPMFESHYNAAKAAGLHVGAYWYVYANTVSGMQAEAKSFVSKLKGKQFDYPVFFDIEDKAQKGMTKAQMTAMVNAGCEILENAGYWVGIYSFIAMLNAQFEKSICDRYSLWVAQWDVQKCTYNGSVNIWQYTDKAYYNGFNGRLDGDISYEDYPTRIKAAGKNGYTIKILDAKGMKEGDKNLGVYELKSMLSLAEAKKLISTHITVDEGFGSGTTAVVNELLRKWGYKQNGIAGEGFVKKLTDMLK
jgi:GH25 family lysozyme M1 (1,4-beta-N-acetylmuramidase)